ncbi:hypothetical protein Cri9333_4831 (plasmid) [Crinalium epipsammum PCC 9333]|uniref:Uncharacterized protein n=1 Tax=Crinalium epipsammum PCC 9333 TaxID=1173022 RepID=K9W768_9CYAN|nr:hypothetical protein [Crinalium epipsammum]AFZ15597.1 hypothetical protein Cri9333_4831 [Crinalium epipsammum PCC 9333]
MNCFIRKIQSLAMWQEGKDAKQILSPLHAMRYALDINKGKGKPSFWRATNEEELEKIVLGMLLMMNINQIDSIRIISFGEECFSGNQGKLSNKEDPSFPIISVRKLHYELNPANETVILPIAETFLSCKGECKEFHKNKTKNNVLNMGEILKKYLNDVSDEYKEKALKLLK